jgi:peroxiredoxin
MSKSLAEALEEAFERCRNMDASLSERLQALADAVRHLSPQFADTVEQLIMRLRQSDAGATAPRPGDPMPSFVLPDERGHLVALQDLLDQGPVAITFHRGHWCPYCRINTDALVKAQKDIAAEGGQVVAVMPDRQQFAAQFKSELQAPFPILTDLDNGYALSLNLAIWVGAEMERFISAAGWDVPKFQGNNSWVLPIPATFVVGKDGQVKERFVDPDYRKRMAIEDMLAALRRAHSLENAAGHPRSASS